MPMVNFGGIGYFGDEQVPLDWDRVSEREIKEMAARYATALLNSQPAAVASQKLGKGNADSPDFSRIKEEERQKILDALYSDAWATGMRTLSGDREKDLEELWYLRDARDQCNGLTRDKNPARRLERLKDANGKWVDIWRTAAGEEIPLVAANGAVDWISKYKSNKKLWPQREAKAKQFAAAEYAREQAMRERVTVAVAEADTSEDEDVI